MKIAYGNSRTTKKWKNNEISWEALCEKLRNPIRTTETVEEYKKMSKKERDDAKDVGGFVGGHLREGMRKANTVLSRSMLTLDMDHAPKGVMELVGKAVDYRMCVYSTHSHTTDAPRFRLLIPLSRDVTPEEYPAVGRMVAKEIGIDFFDDTTYEPNRLMYWPSVSMNGEYVLMEFEGELLEPDDYLSMYDDWRDVSTHPVSSRRSEVVKKELTKQADPLEKDGVVGAFCRTYDIRDAIETFLSHIYEPSAMEGRYDYIPADSSAGVVIYEDKFAYSHHETDPAHGKMLNAFDIVRIHLFGDEDEKVSFKKMTEFAVNDGKVKMTLFEEKQKSASQDFGDEEDGWKKGLIRSKQTGKVENSLHNLILIMKHDEYMKNIVFNQLADGMELKEPIPWRHPSKFWRDQDDAQLICYIDEHYGSFSQRNYNIAVMKTVDDRTYHPIHDFFDSLPEWDGVKRVDTVLIDYLGAEDNEYVRAVTRKLLCAAYVRVYNPGVKFDTMIVLNGGQGIGKSTLINKLGGEWYSDSLNLSDMNDKTAAEKLQGYWIMEIGELAGMKKADLDKVKAFISRQDDKYRASFGRRVTPHPRQCVFFGTTNREDGYLRDITGNRRYWNVRCTGKSAKKPWDLEHETVLQIWAEVKKLAKDGEKLFLTQELEVFAEEEQRKAMEKDDREGLVQEYLDMLLPEKWESMNVYERKNYVRDTDDPGRAPGVKRRESVSNMEIWCECFGKSKEDMKPADSYAISAIMVRLGRWEKNGKLLRQPIYGKQRVYVRKE